MKWLHRGANVLATVMVGLLLSRWIANLPCEFPPLPATVAFCMRLFQIDMIEHADDIETVGLLVIIAASIVIAALPVWFANIGMRRLLLRA